MAGDRSWIRGGLGLLLLLSACNGGDDEETLAPATGARMQAVAVDQRAVQLKWPRDLIADAKGYVVERRQELSGSFDEIANVDASTAGDTLVYLDTSVEPETVYGYRLRGVSALGELGAPTVVAGVRTPSRPGLRVEVTQVGPPEGRDLDGFEVRAVGPDTLAGLVLDAQLFRPVTPGAYVVTLSGAASQCRIADSVQQVNVPDTGIETLRNVAYTVDCRDPSLGDIVAVVAVSRGEDPAGFGVTLTGRPTDPQGTDSVVFLTRDVGPTGGSAAFNALRPGRYEAELTLPARCTLDGPLQRVVDLVPLAADTVRFDVACGGAAGADGDFQPPDPARPYQIRYRWLTAQAAVGSSVTLVATVDLTGGPPFQFGGVQVTTTYDSTRLRATRFAAGTQFTSASNLVSGGLAWLVTVSSSVSTPIEVARITFDVIGGDGQQAVTRSTVESLADFDGLEQPYTGQAQVVLEAPLQIGAGGGGGTTNQPPRAVIAGPASVSVAAGQPLALSSAGSTDPDGTIISYLWTATGATPATATGPSASITYAAAGTYTVRLTVTDDDGASASAEKQVTVAAGGNGGGNQPPIASIDGPATLTATVGTPLALSGASSSDPDGSIVLYTWSLPGAAPASASGATVTATYAVAGTYTVGLTVTDNAGATGTASRTVLVTGGTPPPGGALVLRNAFGSADQQGLVPLTMTLDLTTDLPETPGVERIKEFRIDSLTWNPQLLDFVEVRFPSNVSGSFSYDPGRPGRVFLAGRFVGEGPTGLVPLTAVILRPRAGATGTTTTSTYPSLLQSTSALGSVNYVSQTQRVEATWPVVSGVRGATASVDVRGWPLGVQVSR
jgi:PKD repeat protein